MKKYKNYRLSEKPGFDHKRMEQITEIIKEYNISHPESNITRMESFLESHFRFRIYDQPTAGNEGNSINTEKTPVFKLLFLMDDVPRRLIFSLANQIPNLTPISHFDE
jgi:hypothetical protein